MAESIDITQLKSDLEDLGYPVSGGDGFTGVDTQSLLHYTYFNTNVSMNDALYGLAFPGLLPDGFPGTEEPTPTPVLVSIAVTGTLSVATGDTTQLTATGTYDDDSTADLTSTAVWVSSDETKATVAAGLVTGVAAGSSNITAAVDSVTSPAASVTVTE